MSSLAQALVTYEEFVRLPDPEDGHHYELHDGEIVLVPPPKPRHKVLQQRVMKLLRFLEEYRYEIAPEYPYKPAPQFQFWYADLAVVPMDVILAMESWSEYQCYAPDLVIEVLSPSNREVKVNKQRLACMSHRTLEFWVVDGDKRIVTVSTLTGVREYNPGERIEVLQLGVLCGERVTSVDVASILNVVN